MYSYIGMGGGFRSTTILSEKDMCCTKRKEVLYIPQKKKKKKPEIQGIFPPPPPLTLDLDVGNKRSLPVEGSGLFKPWRQRWEGIYFFPFLFFSLLQKKWEKEEGISYDDRYHMSHKKKKPKKPQKNLYSKATLYEPPI